MWMIEVVTFLALSPSPYMMTPHPTAQYGQVLRVSVVRASLKLRVSASIAVGQNPSAARLEPTRPAALALKNCLRFMSIACPLPLRKIRQLANQANEYRTVRDPGPAYTVVDISGGLNKSRTCDIFWASTALGCCTAGRRAALGQAGGETQDPIAARRHVLATSIRRICRAHGRPAHSIALAPLEWVRDRAQRKPFRHVHDSQCCCVAAPDPPDPGHAGSRLRGRQTGSRGKL